MSATSEQKYDLAKWFSSRSKPGTVAYKIRQLRANGVSYGAALLHFKRGWLLEALIGNRGSLSRTSCELGRDRRRMPDYFEKLGVCKEEAVEIAKQVNGGKR